MLLMILAAQLLIPQSNVTAIDTGLAPRRNRPLTVPPSVSYESALNAPIFAPDRRPGADDGDSVTGVDPLAGYAALGAATGRTFASAIVSVPGGSTRLLRLGDELAGWRLAGISAVRLTFERKGDLRRLVIGAPATRASEAIDTTSSPPAAPR
jgi:hypothetical protein